MDIIAITDIINGAAGVLAVWVPSAAVIAVPLSVLITGVNRLISKKDDEQCSH